MFAPATLATLTSLTALEAAWLQTLSRQLSQASLLAVRVVAQIDSTNQALLGQAAQLPLHPQAPCALLALAQSAGRGRRGRTWVVASDDAATPAPAPAFLASLGVRTRAPVHTLSRLPLFIGVALASQLRAWGVAAQIKWPNDLVVVQTHNTGSNMGSNTDVSFSKLGGILVETCAINGDTAVVMGAGINWHNAPTLATQATTSVAHAISPAALPDAHSACAALLNAMVNAWQACCEQAPLNSDTYAAYDALLDQPVTVFLGDADSYHGVACGINAAGHLGVRMLDGTTRWVHSGDVSVRLQTAQGLPS